MRIRFERTGGFANIRLRTEVDSDKLPAGEARVFHRLVEQARLFDQPAQAHASNQPDQFHYALTITDGDRTHTIETSDGAASDELRSLIDWLLDAARKGQKTIP